MSVTVTNGILFPEQVDCSLEFGNTELKNYEAEQLVKRIVQCLQKQNGKQWQRFSFATYQAQCRRKFLPIEERILYCLTYGGHISPGTVFIEGGYFSEEYGYYTVTEKLLTVLYTFKKNFN